MMWSETVTFGGSGLNRAAHLRTQAQEIYDKGPARVMLLWRGKLLMEADALAWLAPDHPVLADAGPLIFLGQDEEGALFARDISHWEPDGQDTAAVGAFLDQTAQQHPGLGKAQAFLELRTTMTLLSAREAELAATAKGVLGWHVSHGFCAACGAKSEVAMAGWQRDCPACGAHHFPRTDPVVIMLITHGNSVLVGRSPHWPEGMYSLLAGFVEPGETIEAAVRRETFEEAGIPVGDVHYLSSQPWPFPASLMFGCRGDALSQEITLDPAELEDAMWLTKEELAVVFAGEHSEVKPARPGAIAHFLMSNWLADRLGG